MDIEIPDQRLVDLEQALDELLELNTKGRHKRRRSAQTVEASDVNTLLVMRAVYSEAARQGDLAAPLSGALNFYELKARTNLTDGDLDAALIALVGDRLRSRFDAVANYRIYFLPVRQRRLLKKALSPMPSPVPCRFPRLVA